jgi:aspartate aminotransferase-like enzyme
MIKPRLYAPGPVEVPPQVLAALARPLDHHRSETFREAFLEVRAKLAKVACVSGDMLVLSGSGTAALEAGLLATVPKGSKVLAVNAGKFGERWVKLAQAYGYRVIELKLDWGRAARPEEVLERLAGHPDVRAVLATHSETSTGVLHDIEAVTKAVKEKHPDILLLADCVTSLSVTELRPEAWGLDAVLAGSQKGLLTPPGLAFAWLSERAWASMDNLNPSFYLDLCKERERQREGQTAYTPAVSLIFALGVALELILAAGLEAMWRERELLNRAVLEAGEALGCRRYAERASPAVAALVAPEGISAPEIVKGFARRGMRVAGGQDHAKGVLFRPSLLGYADRYDAVTIVAALEDVLRELGRDTPYGQAVGRAMQVLREV